MLSYLRGGAFVYIRLVGVALPWQFELACIALIFVSWGLAFRLNENTFEFIEDNKAILFLVVLYCLLCILFNNDANMHDERFGIEILYIIEAFLGILALVGICRKIKKNKLLSFIGTHSIVYFAFQGQLIKVTKVTLGKVGLSHEVFICFVSAFIATVVLSVVAYVIYKYLPFNVGKETLIETKERLKNIKMIGGRERGKNENLN